MRKVLELPYDVAVTLSDNSCAGLNTLQDQVGCELYLRGNEVVLDGSGKEVTLATSIFEELTQMADEGHKINSQLTRSVASAVRSGESAQQMLSNVIWESSNGHKVLPKTAAQSEYVKAISDHSVTFGIGPAGTGKTFLAVAAAAKALSSGEVKRIILTRPAVEAGERLGFLPGDLMQKVDPYLRPLIDALHDMFGAEKVSGFLESGTVEVAPLAFMRGRTLNDSFIILDEAQNTSPEQMKMFLTRLGYGSKMVITGDVTQIDLPRDQRSGLVTVQRILDRVDGIKFLHFDDQDVVRNALVKRIVRAYDQQAANNQRADF